MKLNLAIVLSVFLVLSAIPLAVAQSSINADYFIKKNSVFVELRFGKVSNFILEIPSDAKNLFINAEKYSIENVEMKKIINVSYSENLTIKYNTEAFIENSKNNFFFIMKNNFNEPSDVNVFLPEGAVLKENGIIFPSDFVKNTDGRRIIVSFRNFSEEQILVNYEFVDNGNNVFYWIVGFVFLAMIAAYFVEKKRIKKEIKEVRNIVNESNKKKTKPVKKRASKKEKFKKLEEDLTRNLLEDEKKIVKYLLEKKDNECWTKEIIKDLEITKVKLSRKLRSLEQKELIKKIPYGNENRIRLLK